MQKLTGQSADVVSENIDQLKTLFPEAVTEGKIDFETLKQLLGDAVEEREEKYGLNWHGKRRARQLALTPSTGTLRPCPEESVDWDTTQNLMIEGDNLEVLKLLQKSYAGKVKLIYIDPPYNTGNDFVYPDDFQDNIKNYLELTGQIEGGKKISSNSESSGRFHTDWMNMMCPRLKLAWNLLRVDGIIMISIDDHELENLRLLCNEIFGEETFLINLVWQRRQMADSRNEDRASTDHEYVVCYRKQNARLKGNPIDKTKYSNPDNDPRGAWFSADLTGLANKEERPNLHYDLVNPETGLVYPPSPTRGWSCAPNTMARLIEEKRIIWPPKPEGRPRSKKFLEEATKHETGFSSWLEVGQTTEGTRVIQELFGEKVFPYTKPPSLLKTLIDQATDENEGIILDFFAGSGTTGHAVIDLNKQDGGSRKYILVQLPEPTGRKDYLTISDITKERLRRAAMKIKAKNPLFAGDLGFRVFKLDASNIRAWQPNRDDLEQTLLDHAEHIVAGRSEQDILYELLLKLGLDLTVPIETRTIHPQITQIKTDENQKLSDSNLRTSATSADNEFTVYSIGAGALLVCLAESIGRDAVEPLAQGIIGWHAELKPAVDTRLVFRDSAFADDVTKTNLTAILQQHALDDVRSL